MPARTLQLTVLLSLLLPLTVSAARPSVLLLQRTLPRFDSALFALALRMQLGPYAVQLRTLPWLRPRGDSSRRWRQAQALRQHLRSQAVLWLEASGPNLQVLVLEARDRQARVLPLGPPGPGLEREAAAAVRTLLAARVLRLPRRPARPATRPTTPTRAVTRPSTLAATRPSTLAATRPTMRAATQPTMRAATRPTMRPTTQPTTRPAPGRRRAGPFPRSPASRPSASRQADVAPWLWLTLGYALDALPLGPELRHGPELALHLDSSRWRWSLQFGYRLPNEGEHAGALWSRSIYQLALEAGPLWRFGARLRLGAALRARVGVVAAQALGGTRQQSTLLAEFALGISSVLELQLRPRIHLQLRIGSAIQVVSHELVVAGAQVGKAGRLEFLVVPSLVAGLW